ncbi:MAG: beta-lactamase family protein [Deltaproteobacteria bacterium]|nr:beta-lactamase family protein [Deltaproteobacteria bacterium]
MNIHTEIRWHQEPEAADLDRALLETGVAALVKGCEQGWHHGAQVAVGRHGRLVVEYAVGESSPGHPMGVDSLTAWFSASKPVVAMALALLYDRGLLTLDDPVVRYIPGFTQGKESCTLRHVLTHTGGFPNALKETDLEWEEALRRICAHPAEYVPGSRAGYHSTSGWYILGEVARVVDGRPIDQLVTEELFAPLGMSDSHLGIPPERQEALRERLATVHLGAGERESYVDQAFVNRWNSPRQLAAVNPSGGIRGPARDLGRFYDWLLLQGLWEGRSLVDRRTVELFTACHRWGLSDMTLAGAPLAWGLGFSKHGNSDIHRDYSRRLFNHSGMVSSVALGDPASGLSCVVITTGLLDPLTNARRLREANGTVIGALKRPPAGP